MSSALLYRQTFRKNERLCSKKIFEQLVKGKSIHDFPFRLLWINTILPVETPVQVAFSVPKRNFKNATDRNRIKRLMREVYRKNKAVFYPFLSEFQYAMLFIFTGKQAVTYSETEKKIRSLLTQFAEDIKKNIS